MKRLSAPRNTAHLSESVHRQLNMYALAVSAAGVGMLALSQPANAEIIYTATNMKIQGQLQLDIDNNGTVDFVLWHSNTCNGSTCASFLLAYPNFTVRDGFLATAHGRFKSAVAMNRGTKITRGDIFNENIGPLAEHVNKPVGTHHSTYWKGQWANGGQGLANEYLGLKFSINGSVHFGWARITVKTGTGFGFIARLTGYAYETVAGKAIVAGRTQGTDDNVEAPNASVAPSTSRPDSLGMLALGAPALSIWRRENS